VVDTEPAPSSDARIRVLVVDDHLMFAELLTSTLGACSDITVAGIARDGDAALRALSETPPDVVVLDYRLPGDDGVTVATRIRRASPDTKIVMLTGHDDDGLLRAALAAGCSGFIAKDRAATELIDAVRTVHSGRAAVDVAAAARLAQGRPRVSGPAALTPRELEVLELLAGGASTREIADRLFISLNTARNHVQRLIAKLGAHSRLEAVAIARRAGLLDTLSVR